MLEKIKFFFNAIRSVAFMVQFIEPKNIFEVMFQNTCKFIWFIISLNTRVK